MGNSPIKFQYKVVSVFAFLIFLLCGQFYFSIRYQEPYPCIRFPGFGSIPGIDSFVNATSYTVLVSYENDKDTLIPCRKSFPSIPQWYVPYVMKSIFEETEVRGEINKRKELKDWLKKSLQSSHGLNKIQVIELRKEEVKYDKTLRSESQRNVIDSRTFRYDSN